MKAVRYGEKKESFWKSKKFLTLLMGLFIISIMVFSVLYYGLDRTDQKEVEYKGLTFTETSVGWQAYTEENQRILIQSDPSTLDSEIITGSADFSFLEGLQKVYVSFNPYSDVSSALVDFQQNMPGSAVLVASCYEASDACIQLPIKDCDDATLTTGVVIFKDGNTSTVTLDGNCLVVEGKNLLILTDKLVVDSYV
ncbi:hypothetical protein EXS74_03110 [Candidatus Woesearchaeota archaeon]|nr:hypothetical protein [Candidatus Woesearchaeota archaeon]